MLTGAAGRIRTHDLRLRRPSLYPAELLPHTYTWDLLISFGKILAVSERFELSIEVLAPILA